MKTILIGLMMVLPVMSMAQGGKRVQERKENIEAQKVAFITKELDLTPEESQKFWPVYNQCQKDRQELRKQRRETIKNHKNMDEMSDAEVQKAMDNLLVNKQKELDLEKQYHSKYLAVLPVKKVARLYGAEEKFKRMLLEKIKEKKDGKDVHHDFDHE